MPITYDDPAVDDEEISSQDEIDPGLPMSQDQPVNSVNLPVPPPAAPPQPMAAPPLGPPVPRAMRPPVNQSPGGFNMELWREQNANMPLAQAEESVSAALRFQGIRQYQQDLAAGKTPAEALARSAPLMFSGPKNANLGQAASFIRQTRPTVQRPINIGGVGYRMNADGSLTPLTAPKQPGVANLGPTIIRIGKLEDDLKDTRTPAEIKAGVPDPGFGLLADEKRAQLNALRQQVQRAQRTSTPPALLPGAPAPPRGPDPGMMVAPQATQGSPSDRGMIVAPQGTPGASGDRGMMVSPETPKVTSKEQFDRLPSGAIYIGKNGRRYRKP